MKVYKKINGSLLVATLDDPLIYTKIKVIALNYQAKGKIKIIKNFNSNYEYVRESTFQEDDLYYNELVS